MNGDLMTELSFREFRKKLLIEVARADERHPGDYIDPERLAMEAQLDFKPGWVRKAAQSFDSEGFVKAGFHLGGGHDGGCDMAISAYGLEQVEEWLEEDAVDPIVVTIDRHSEEFRTLVGKLDELIECVRSSNEFAAKEPNDQQQVIAELEAGKRLVKASRVRLAALRTTLGTPLKYLSTKFGDATISTIAKATLKAVASFFGINL